MSKDNCGSRIGLFTFITGAAVGASIAILLAPRTGRETRQRLAEYGSEFIDKSNEYRNDQSNQTDAFVDKGKSMIDKGRSLIDQGNAMVSQGKDFLDDKKKALNEAIEAGKEAMQEEKEALAASFNDE